MFRFDKAVRQEFRINWLPLATAFSCLLFGLSASAFSAPFLFPELIAEYGWSREQATLFASTKYASATFGALFFGLTINRIGVWPTLLFVMSLAGAGMVSWLWMDGLTIYYLSGAMTGFAVGGGGIAIKVLVARAFHASQGTAMGIALTGAALAGSIIPVVISFLISNFGWRYGYAALSLAVWFIVLPLLIYGYTVSRREKAATGVAPDDPTDAALSEDRKGAIARITGYMRQKNFWMVAAALSVSSIVDAGFTQHQVLILRDFNFEQATIVSVISIIGLVNVGARIVSGNIMDSTSNKGMAGLYFTLLLACALAPLLSLPLVLFIFILFRAFGHSAVMLDTAVMTKHAFGNVVDLGLLYALMSACTSAGSATGPWIMGRIFDVTGSYNMAYVVFAGLSILAVVLAWNVKPVYWLSLNQKKAEESQAAMATSSVATDSRQG